MSKYFLKSKTFWVNVIAGGALVLKHLYGFGISGEESASLLVVINLVLRGITGEPLSLSDSGTS